MKVVTVVGTRPEIIRLSRVITRLDNTPGIEHVLVHTGQNYDHSLNQVFFDDLGLREPDHYLNANTASLGTVLGGVLIGTEGVLLEERPDAVVVLGDTNSCIATVMAKRMRIPTYHMEAGNRSFDENVPEETNRRLVDHVADFNLVYTEHARRNLLAEGLHPERILLTGSPMREVLQQYRDQIEASDVLDRLHLAPQGYFLVSAHREENVDHPERLQQLVDCLLAVHEKWNLPVVVSTHPRTRKRLEALGAELGSADIRWMEPFGFHDYSKLQVAAACVLSDSGTVSEESSILDFPAITLRDSIERPEALDTGAIVMTGLDAENVVSAVAVAMEGEQAPLPAGYEIGNTSQRTVRFILSTASRHHQLAGIRTWGYRMKVLVFADFRSPHAQGWADGLEMCGMEVGRVSSLGEPTDAAGGGIRGEAGRQMVRRLSRDVGHRVRTAEALVRQPGRRRVLTAVSRDFQPDIVHALRLPYEGVSALSALSAVRDSVPVVVSTWGQDFVAQAAADPVLRTWIRRVIPAADGLIADVQSDVDRARDYGLGNVPTLVAAANFGLEVGTPSRIDIESPTVTYTRGLATHVDYNAFIAAIPLVIERAKLPWKFIGIGLEGVPGTRTLLEDVACGERVQFTGNVDLAKFKSLIRASAATCSPAISDGMPISVLMSLAEGRATLVGALPQYVEIAASTPLLRIMSGTDAGAISAAILELDEIWSTSGSPTLTPHVPSTYDRRRNRDVVPEFYERVIRGRRAS